MSAEKQNKITLGKKYRGIDNQIYRVTGQAEDTRTHEQMVIFQEQFGGFNLFVMPSSDFVKEVDTKEHPSAKQKYMFERLS